jgi:hypothetical protein
MLAFLNASIGCKKELKETLGIVGVLAIIELLEPTFAYREQVWKLTPKDLSWFWK